MREDEAIILLKQSREHPRDHLGMHLVRVRQERQAILLAHAFQNFFDAGHRAVEEVAPHRMKRADVAAISGLVAKKLVKLPEGDGAALHVAIAAGVFEQID